MCLQTTSLAVAHTIQITPYLSSEHSDRTSSVVKIENPQ